jgi:hypothetical protein
MLSQELAAGEDMPQSSTGDDLQTTRKYYNELQKEKLTITGKQSFEIRAKGIASQF